MAETNLADTDFPCEQQKDLSDNSSAVLITVLKTLQIPVSPLYVRGQIQKEESPASALAIVNVGNALGLTVDAFEADLDALSDLSPPFIAHMTGDLFTVLQAVGETDVTLADPQKGIQKMSRQEFESKSTGIFIVPEKEEGYRFRPPPGHTRYQIQEVLQEHLKWVISVGLAVLLFAFSLVGLTLLPNKISEGLYALLLGINFISMGIAFLLSEYVLEGHQPKSIVNRLCSISSKFKCSSVLLSPIASFLGKFPFAILGLGFYFSVQVLLGVVGPAALPFVAFAYTGSLILALYLIHMQWKVLKEWCAWCMVLHGMNLVACLLSWGLFSESGADFDDVAAGILQVAFLFGLLLAGVVLVYFFRITMKSSREVSDRFEEEMNRMKSPPVLAAIVESTAPLEVMRPEGGEWAFGNPEAPMKLVVFSSPFCPACAQLDKDLRANISAGLPVQLIVRLVGPPLPEKVPDVLGSSGKGDLQSFSLFLYAVASAMGPEAYYEALGLIYSRQSEFLGKTVGEFREALGVPKEMVEGGISAGFDQLKVDEKIATGLSIEKTPVLYLNNRPLPDWVRVPELTGLFQFLFQKSSS